MWGLFTPIIIGLLLIVSWRTGVTVISAIIAYACLGAAAVGAFYVLAEADASALKWVLMLAALGGAAVWVASKVDEPEG